MKLSLKLIEEKYYKKSNTSVIIYSVGNIFILEEFTPYEKTDYSYFSTLESAQQFIKDNY